MHATLELRETPTSTDACTLAVAGELDIGTAPRFRTKVSTLMGIGCRHVSVDLSEATFLDSSGLGAIVWAAHRLQAAGGDLTLVDASDAVASTLEVTGVGPLLGLP
ncbi:MAG TPA: STAS domain-containing protein [Solirubrobacteraceae bacterium]|nr:STAS domain-containing protein [Solirubrobacteraceae bacterium]